MSEAQPVEPIFLTPTLLMGGPRGTMAEMASLYYKAQFGLCVCLCILTPPKLLDVRTSKLARLITTSW